MNETLKHQRDYAWNYFQLHAGQRMSTFNFFIVIAALLTTGLASTFVKDFKWQGVGFILGIALVGISFVFWKLDQRVRFLIKHAEAVLKEIEQKTLSESSGDTFIAALFLDEEAKTSEKKKKRNFRFWQRHFSYSNCFETIYFILGLLGFLGAIGSLMKYRPQQDLQRHVYLVVC